MPSKLHLITLRVEPYLFTAALLLLVSLLGQNEVFHRAPPASAAAPVPAAGEVDAS